MYMASQHSYEITIKNNQTENEAIAFVMAKDPHFLNPDKASRKRIMEALGLDKGFSRAFDLVLIKDQTSKSNDMAVGHPKDITLVELKTTRKKLPNNPRGFFFGATKNEFDLAEKLGPRYKFCFVSLHPKSRSYKLLNLLELKSLIRTQRVQYQINLMR